MLIKLLKFFKDFETYLKTKIEKLAHLETDNLECKSPDFHEQFSTKSFDESKASVYFTPTEGHLSPEPMQFSPIHINYINEGMVGCESAYSDEAAGPWRSIPFRNVPRNPSNQRNSFTLPFDYLDEEEETPGNFIVPDPVYADDALNRSSDKFHDVIETPATSMLSLNSSELNARRRKKKYKEHRRSRPSIENETLLLQDVVHDVSKGARPKVYGFHSYGRKSGEPIGEHVNPTFSDKDIEVETPSSSSSDGVKKVNSLVNIDEKTGKVVATSAGNDLDLSTNFDDDEKMMNEKIIKLHSSNSLPDMQSPASSPSSSATNSSNSNNQIQGHGKHVVLALEAQNGDALNQMDFTLHGEGEHSKAKIKMNIDEASCSSSSTSSSNNLKYGSTSTPSTL